jgi:hypothetical protein
LLAGLDTEWACAENGLDAENRAKCIGKKPPPVLLPMCNCGEHRCKVTQATNNYNRGNPLQYVLRGIMRTPGVIG